MQQQRTAADVLHEAADLLDRRGWCKGKASDEHGRLCVIGAIYTAATGGAYGGLKGEPDTRAGQAAAACVNEYAERRLRHQGLEAPGGTGGLLLAAGPFWNDHVCRDGSEAADLLRACAAEVEAVNR